MIIEGQLSLLGDSPAKTSPLPGNAPDWMVNAVDFFGKSFASLKKSSPKSSYWKMCRASSAAMVDGIWEPSSGRWGSSGIASDGECWTLNTSECPKDGGVSSSLRHILEQTPLPKYCLSAKAAQGILRRATNRGKTLPEPLQKALEMVATE